MYKVILVCQSGMSSSFIVKAIKKAFDAHNEEIEIHAHAAMELVDFIGEVDTVLIAPNVLYMMSDIESTCQEHHITPIVIPVQQYGQMDGEAIRKLII
ncbi:MAG: hypothetical protein H0S79_05655 [Anaerolineaceae bacterium]|jgi:PTS system cellobiose-specific IIB component|nr:hypothetical protein [Anaerolineaceae bacterium]